jgi:hypothetical protein
MIVLCAPAGEMIQKDHFDKAAEAIANLRICNKKLDKCYIPDVCKGQVVSVKNNFDLVSEDCAVHLIEGTRTYIRGFKFKVIGAENLLKVFEKMVLSSDRDTAKLKLISGLINKKLIQMKSDQDEHRDKWKNSVRKSVKQKKQPWTW